MRGPTACLLAILVGSVVLHQNENAWMAMRRGILAHVREGRITPMEFATYTFMILAADKRNGCWRGSAPALVAQFDGTWDLTGAKVVLQSLEEKGYIKRLLKQQGHKGNYYIVVNKYLVTIGPNAGELVNASATVSEKTPVFFSEDSEESQEPSEGETFDVTQVVLDESDGLS